MRTATVKLVTIVAERGLQERLIQDITRLGAGGYTLMYVGGAGNRRSDRTRARQWYGENVRIETLVSAAVADRVLEHLAREYFPLYAIIAYMTDAYVVREDKFTSWIVHRSKEELIVVAEQSFANEEN